MVDAQVVEALHAKDDDGNIPLKPLEAMLSIDLAHPNIIHTFKFYTRICQVIRCCKALLTVSALLGVMHCSMHCFVLSPAACIPKSICWVLLQLCLLTCFRHDSSTMSLATKWPRHCVTCTCGMSTETRMTV